MFSATAPDIQLSIKDLDRYPDEEEEDKLVPVSVWLCTPLTKNMMLHLVPIAWEISLSSVNHSFGLPR